VIERLDFGDVVQLRMSSRISRLVGYSASAFVVRGVMVDVGFPKVGGELAGLLDRLSLRGAIVTHKHEDHAGNVSLLASRGIPIRMARDTLAYVQEPESIAFYRWVTWGTPGPLVQPVEPFEDDVLQFVSAPGHSPDHHVVWDPERRVLFSGDLFLGVKVRIAHPGENPRELVSSLRKVSSLGPDVMYCAHRGRVENATEMLQAKADWTEETIAEIELRISQGWSDREIRSTVLGGESMSGWLSRGDYSRTNFVRAVRESLS
jgi:glyoxylase-like metal-dependent hydrolase (beta-lactamase superfamily II)